MWRRHAVRVASEVDGGADQLDWRGDFNLVAGDLRKVQPYSRAPHVVSGLRAHSAESCRTHVHGNHLLVPLCMRRPSKTEYFNTAQGIPEKATKSLRLASFLPQHLVLQVQNWELVVR